MAPGVFGNAALTDKAQVPDQTPKNRLSTFAPVHSLLGAATAGRAFVNGYDDPTKLCADVSGHTARRRSSTNRIPLGTI